MSMLTARWAPKLTKEQKRERVRVIRELLSRYKAEEDFLDRIVTGDLGFECSSHPPYSPDLAPSDYWLFGKMKRPIRGKVYLTVGFYS